MTLRCRQRGDGQRLLRSVAAAALLLATRAGPAADRMVLGEYFTATW